MNETGAVNMEPFQKASPLREWAEGLYNVRRWTRMPSGGHFAPTEEPEVVARDIAALFTEAGRAS